MSTTPESATITTKEGRWWHPTLVRCLALVLLIQAVLFLSENFGWFQFNRVKGCTSLVAVAVSVALLLILGLTVLIGWFFRGKSQYSLATLLLIVPVMAIPCGWLSRDIRRAEFQRETVSLIRKHGAVTYASTSDPLSERIRNLMGDDYVHEVESVDLREIELLPRLTAFRELSALLIASPQTTDLDLDHVSKMAQLVELKLECPLVTNNGLANLSRLSRLRFLRLDQTQVNDDGLKYLRAFPELVDLSLLGTRVTDAGMPEVAELIQLNDLVLNGTDITDAGLARLAPLTQLRFLGIAGTHVTDAGMETVNAFQELDHLSAGETRIGDDGVARLKGFPKLHTIWLEYTNVGATGVLAMRNLPAITNIHLSRSKFPSEIEARVRPEMKKALLLIGDDPRLYRPLPE